MNSMRRIEQASASLNAVVSLRTFICISFQEDLHMTSRAYEGKYKTIEMTLSFKFLLNNIFG